MRNRTQNLPLRKILPVVVAAAIGIAGCAGEEQAGDTNAGLAGGLAGGGVSAGTVLGVVGGVALAGLLLDSDSDGGTANASNGATNGGTTDGGTTNGGTTDGGTTNGGTTDGGTTNGGTTDGGTTNGGTTDGGTTNGGTTNGGTTNGGTTDGGTTDGGTTDGGAVLADNGAVQTDLVESQAVPATGSAGIGTANLTFNRTTGDASGSVTLSGVSANRVDIMVGPPGTNGFVALALEMTGPDEWSVPATLSANQQDFILQNLNSGNLYIAARNDAFPDGEIRRQLTPNGVAQYTTSETNANGTADGYLLVNEITGDYSITWNTSDDSLSHAHVNDGIVSDATENNYALLTQRTSNPRRFFLDGNFNDPADPLYPDLLTRIANDQVWLDAHSADDTRVFFSPLR